MCPPGFPVLRVSLVLPPSCFPSPLWLTRAHAPRVSGDTTSSSLQTSLRPFRVSRPEQCVLSPRARVPSVCQSLTDLASSPPGLRDLQTAQAVKNLPVVWETWARSLGREDTWRRTWRPTPVFLPGESHGQRSLLGSMGLHGSMGSQRVGQD